MLDADVMMAFERDAKRAELKFRKLSEKLLHILNKSLARETPAVRGLVQKRAAALMLALFMADLGTDRFNNTVTEEAKEIVKALKKEERKGH